MPSIFISYRQQNDGGWTGRIYDQLKNRYGSDHVFRDITDIHPGEDWAKVLDEQLASSDIFLAVITKAWASAKDKHGHVRLGQPTDYVTMEINAAIRRGIQIFPLLVDGATLPPKESLPEPLEHLRAIQKLEIGDRNFDAMVALLMDRIELKRKERVESLRQQAKEAQNSKRYREEITLWQQILDYDSRDTDALAALQLAQNEQQKIQDKVANLRIEAEAALGSKKFSIAASLLEEAARTDPNPEGARRILSVRWRESWELKRLELDRLIAGAGRLWDTGDYPQAEQFFGQVLRDLADINEHVQQWREKVASERKRREESPPQIIARTRLSRSRMNRLPWIAAVVIVLTAAGLGTWWFIPKRNPEALVMQGVEAMELGNFKTAAEYFQRAEPDPRAQTYLGQLYATGRGVPQNFVEAARLYKLAADQEYGHGFALLGSLYREGKGVQQDVKKAVELYKTAANYRSNIGQRLLGELLEKGELLPQNLNEAARLYKLAAQQGDKGAQDSLDRLLLQQKVGKSP